MGRPSGSFEPTTDCLAGVYLTWRQSETCQEWPVSVAIGIGFAICLLFFLWDELQVVFADEPHI